MGHLVGVRELVIKWHQATSIHDLFSFPRLLCEADIIVPVLLIKKLNQRD